MTCFSFYHETSGVLHANTIVVDAPNAEAVAQLNCPPGHKPIEGNFDPLSQRIDVDLHRQFATIPHITRIYQPGEPHETREVAAQHRAERDALWAKVVIDYQPPAPSADHEWNGDTKRWQLSAAAHAKVQARAGALAAIDRIEGQSIRAMREALLGLPGSQERVATIDAQIEALRTNL
jgi:hypothetical protein